jgi:hypothetical protein
LVHLPLGLVVVGPTKVVVGSMKVVVGPMKEFR